MAVRKRRTEDQIIRILQEADSGVLFFPPRLAVRSNAYAIPSFRPAILPTIRTRSPQESLKKFVAITPLVK